MRIFLGKQVSVTSGRREENQQAGKIRDTVIIGNNPSYRQRARSRAHPRFRTWLLYPCSPWKATRLRTDPIFTGPRHLI